MASHNSSGSPTIGGGWHCESAASQCPLYRPTLSQWQHFIRLTAVRRLAYLPKAHTRSEEWALRACSSQTPSLYRPISVPMAAILPLKRCLKARISPSDSREIRGGGHGGPKARRGIVDTFQKCSASRYPPCKQRLLNASFKGRSGLPACCANESSADVMQRGCDADVPGAGVVHTLVEAWY